MTQISNFDMPNSTWRDFLLISMVEIDTRTEGMHTFMSFDGIWNQGWLFHSTLPVNVMLTNGEWKISPVSIISWFCSCDLWVQEQWVHLHSFDMWLTTQSSSQFLKRSAIWVQQLKAKLMIRNRLFPLTLVYSSAHWNYVVCIFYSK